MKYNVWVRIQIERADEENDDYVNVWNESNEEEQKLGIFFSFEDAVKFAEHALDDVETQL